MNGRSIRSGRHTWILIAALASAGCAAAAPVSTAEDIAQLKAQLAAQQAQIDELRRALLEQNKEHSLASAERPAPIPPPVAPGVTPPALPGSAAQKAGLVDSGSASPLTFRIGSASITPIGFMDFTTVFRSRTGGSSIGTNFGSIPFANTVPGQLSEFRLSAQNSRVGLRVDAKVHGANVLGYLESDFLGFSPGNAAVSSNSNNLRIRLYWVDVKKNKFEILGGQSWSMMTPNRRGLSPLPADLFYSQDIDVNYQLGLTWSRAPQFRLVYHPTARLAMGLSLEASEQYGGGSAGGGVITMPSALVPSYTSELNTGGNTFGVPSLHPDIIGKIAWDPRVAGRNLHVEVAGLLTSFKFYNPLTHNSYATQGGGGAVNLNLELVKNFRLITNNYFSDGSGRYIFGQGPDLIIRADGSPSLVHSASTVSGFEYQPRSSFMVYAYYGGAYFQRNATLDPASGKPVGYGYAGSPNGQNRAIQEATFGFTDTFWKDSKYGALQFMTQYSYLSRNPWSVAAGQPSNASMNMVFANLRYTLPGAPPSVE